VSSTRQPPYHLRVNKAVDRFVFLEAVRMLAQSGRVPALTYYGFGGPFLDEFRFLYETCPSIRMVSIEENEEILKRQRFHVPCRKLELVHDQSSSYLARLSPGQGGGAFWLDYTGLEYQAFDDLMVVLEKTQGTSLVKVTLRAEPKDFEDDALESRDAKVERFQRAFGNVLPQQSVSPPTRHADFAAMLQEMVRVACQKALTGFVGKECLPLTSFYYADGVGMYTFTGVVCPTADKTGVRARFQGLPFANSSWLPPTRIDVPQLSTKERLHLQRHLPRRGQVGKRLRTALGYLVDNTQADTEYALGQYAEFHRCSPYFMKAIP
jgi:hypothetical protein